MWHPKAVGITVRRAGRNGLVAVAIDSDKGSQYALRWTIDNLLSRGQTVILIHVVHRPSSAPGGNHTMLYDPKGTKPPYREQLEKQTEELFLTFHCFCTRKDIHSFDVVLEDTDIAKALTEYVSHAAIETLVLGAPSRHGFLRKFKMADMPGHVSKGAPDFCTVYVVSKGKIASMRNASRPAPFASPLHEHIKYPTQDPIDIAPSVRSRNSFSIKGSRTPGGRTPRRARNMADDYESLKSPFSRGIRGGYGKFAGDMSESDTDISFVSSGRPSTDRISTSTYSYIEPGRISQTSTNSDQSFGMSLHVGPRFNDITNLHDVSSVSLESGRTSSSSQSMDDMEAEMRRLKIELKQTMDLYSTACKEALSAKQKAVELEHWRVEEIKKLKEAAENADDEQKAKCKEAIETVEAEKKAAELEAERQTYVGMKALQEVVEKKRSLVGGRTDVWYRRYSIEEIETATEFFNESRKVGEGGYGPVFKCNLDHTPVAVKVLRPDAAQGREQFQLEVEVLSCMRHPNMVILVGACPEYGCLVYEYMANGSLEDRLFRRGDTPPLSWQLRFRIAAEIATGLLFLHQTKPEPLVHRDLKPGNILLDHNWVSKISDVGLARLVPPTVADDITQYRMTSTAGTFCYIDPEYQQTGMLGIKSDVYSLGIVLLQLITAKPAMGLTHHVGQAMEKGTFEEMLDPAVQDWPVEEALCLAKIAIQCAELRRKDRPDLGKVVLPELNRLRELGDEKLGQHFMLCPKPNPASDPNSHVLDTPDVISDPQIVHSGFDSLKSNSSSSSLSEKPPEITD